MAGKTYRALITDELKAFDTSKLNLRQRIAFRLGMRVGSLVKEVFDQAQAEGKIGAGVSLDDVADDAELQARDWAGFAQFLEAVLPIILAFIKAFS